MRLQKYLAMQGVASRRQCENHIAAGLVAVNGETVTEMGFQIDPENDRVTFRGKPVTQPEEKITILLHKPVGVISTAQDPFGRQTVVELVNRKERLYPVGRLDYLTSGLILLTNDGELALKLTHPRYETKKVYQAWLKGIITEEKMRQFRNGLQVEDYVTQPAGIRILKREKNRCQVEIVLREGRNRQVRKMCEVLGYPVSQLKRVAIGPLQLGDLQPGQWRQLTAAEINSLLGKTGRVREPGKKKQQPVKKRGNEGAGEKNGGNS